MLFHYKAKSKDGKETETGTTQASSREEAIAKLAACKIMPFELGEEGKPLTPVRMFNPAQPENPVKPAPDMVANQTANKTIPTDPKRMEVLPPPPPKGAVPARSPLADTITRPQNLNKVAEIGGSRRRKESILIGFDTAISAQAEDLLSKKNGTVKHISITPDAYGKTKVAIVIEHDI